MFRTGWRLSKEQAETAVRHTKRLFWELPTTVVDSVDDVACWAHVHFT